MKILHTSDWHLGRMLHGRRRYAEFEAFLQWLAQAIEREAVEVVLVAGDVFDTALPSNRAQALYYRFLCQVAQLGCRHVVVVAGNHDSPTFLDAPGELLRALDVHVVGVPTEDPAGEVLVLRDRQGRAELLVCAVPYLRDRDLRSAEAGESLEDKERKLLQGIAAHYAQVVAAAEQRRAGLDPALPMVAMGHLFTAGGQTIDGDGVRELYVGSLAHVTPAIFPASVDYVALGHLHVPQAVGGQPRVRYSGSPLPMGFGEARQHKSVCLVELARAGQEIVPRLLEVPCLQRLERVQGDWPALEQRLQALKEEAVSVWLEVVYLGQELMADLRERLDALVQGSALEILRVRNQRVVDQVLAAMEHDERLDELEPEAVFVRCLDAHEVPDAQRAQLLQTHGDALRSLQQADPQAE